MQRPTATHRAVRRAQIILHPNGLSQAETARRVGVNRPAVGVWNKRFRDAGLAGLSRG